MNKRVAGDRGGVAKHVIGEPTPTGETNQTNMVSLGYEEIGINDKTFVTCHNHLNAIIPLQLMKKDSLSDMLRRRGGQPSTRINSI